MKGQALVFNVHSSVPSEYTFNVPPSLDFLQDAVGGPIELIPHFSSIAISGYIRNCFAYCNEEGKLQRLKPNAKAQQLWQDAMVRTGVELTGDVLLGSVVILYGDNTFMESL